MRIDKMPHQSLWQIYHDFSGSRRDSTAKQSVDVMLSVRPCKTTQQSVWQICLYSVATDETTQQCNKFDMSSVRSHNLLLLLFSDVMQVRQCSKITFTASMLYNVATKTVLHSHYARTSQDTKEIDALLHIMFKSDGTAYMLTACFLSANAYERRFRTVLRRA